MPNYLIDYYYQDENGERIIEKETDEISASNDSLAIYALNRKRGVNLEIISIFDEEDF